MDKEHGCALPVLLILTAFCALVIGISEGVRFTRKEAVEAGVGHFVADPETGSVSFEWKTAKERR